jgi:oligopeptide/dipeptide ABC transporter ATP-binding protein
MTALLTVTDLAVEFSQGRRKPPLRAVDGVSLELDRKETLGVVGESGSGKTTLGRAVLGLVPVNAGTIEFNGEDITHATYRRRRALSRDLQVVFQDPYSSLNPVRTIGQTLEETLRPQGVPGAARQTRVREILERVGLPAEAWSRYPGHFSGGQRQRIAIARALIVQPQLVICDEPVSALDLSIQAQILNLLRELQRELGLAYLLISHDLAVVRNFAHRIVVLYRGRVMEEGRATEVYSAPAHPYTRALLNAAPVPDPKVQRARRGARPRGADASPLLVAEACPFALRCPHSAEPCFASRPQLEKTPEGSSVACHRWRELRATSGQPPVATELAS